MRISLYLLSIVLVVVICCSASAENDYFNRITMASDGRITRFPHSPISVYVADIPVPERLRHAYVSDVEYALGQWSGCSEGKLRFQRVDSEEADIRIYWAEGSSGPEIDPLGEASLFRFDSGDFYVQMSILLEERPSLRDSRHAELRAVLLHELGHAIGLWGHSTEGGDIMCRSGALHPTRRDKSVLLKLLSTPVDYPFHQSAIAEIKSDLNSTPDAAYLRFWLGTVYADQGEDYLAIGELLAALRLSPNLLKASSRLGRIFQKEGMYEMAIAYYSKEMEAQPSPGLHGLIGLLYLRQERFDKAVDCFQKALSMDKDFSEARINSLAAYHLWASELIEDDQTDEAVSVLFRALELFPSSRVIYYDLGTAYDTSGQYEKAVEQYEKALEIEPSFTAAKGDIASCMNNLGAKRIREKDWEGSIQFCKQAVQWDPDCWEAYANLEAATFGLGREKHQAGLLDEAIPHYRAVLDMSPANLDAYSMLGYVFYEKEMYKDALEQFEIALSIDPEFQNSVEGLATVKRRINFNRAKIAVLLTAVSMLLCFSIVFLSRYGRRRKTSAHATQNNSKGGGNHGHDSKRLKHRDTQEVYNEEGLP